MRQKVAIKIAGHQKTNDTGEQENFEYNSEGLLYQKGRHYYLIYKEKAQGLDGIRTTLKINPRDEKITLLRHEPFEIKQVFIAGQKTQGKYGQFFLETHTQEMEIDINDGNGEIRLYYIILFDGHEGSYNRLRLRWST